MPPPAAAGGAVRGARALSLPSQELDLAALLGAFDGDGDGEIDAEEMKELNRREAARRESVENHITRVLNRERDLKRENDDLDEQLGREGVDAAKELHGNLQQLDSNADGGIAEDELEQAVETTEEDMQRARLQQDELELPRMRLAMRLYEYPGHVARRRDEGLDGEVGAKLRARLRQVERRFLGEIKQRPAPRGAQAEALKAAVGEVARIRDAVAEIEMICHGQFLVDASADPSEPLPGPTPLACFAAFTDALEEHMLNWSAALGEFQSLQEQREEIRARVSGLAAPQELGELDEPPPLLRLPERREVQRLGWDRLWDGKRRAEVQRVLAASKAQCAELSEDMELGKRHVEELTREEKVLCELSRAVGTLRETAAKAGAASDAAWHGLRLAADAYAVAPATAEAACERDVQLLQTTQSDSAARDREARARMLRRYGKGADWYRESRKHEEELQSQLMTLRQEHSVEVRRLTHDLKQLHEEKKREEQRLMAASFKYFQGVEQRQREIVRSMERLQTDYSQRTKQLTAAVREAREQRRQREARERQEMANAIAEEKRRRALHLLTMERLKEMQTQTSLAKDHFQAALRFTSACVGAGETAHSFLWRVTTPQLTPLEAVHTGAQRERHASLGRAYLLHAQLVYKNSVRRAELQTQQKLITQQLEFCKDTWDPNERRHQEALAVLAKEQSEMQRSEDEWRQAMKALLREQRAIADDMRNRGLRVDDLVDAKAELNWLFQEQERRRRARGRELAESECNNMPPTLRRALLITDGSDGGECPSPLRAWHAEQERMAEEQRRVDEAAEREAKALLQAQRESSAELERRRLEQRRLHASSHAANSRTQHIAKHHLKRTQKRGRSQTPQRKKCSEVMSAVIRLDFPEVTDDDAILLPHEPSRLDPGDVRVRTLLDFDPGNDQSAQRNAQSLGEPPPPPPSPPPPPPSDPPDTAGQNGRACRAAPAAAVSPAPALTALASTNTSCDEAHAMRLEPELAAKRGELMQYLAQTRDAAQQAGQSELAGQLQGVLSKYQSA
eukprot:TRINITY_DN50548_c0_g1_i1.p1 TRINITY_DN50548_c0_g1~~TRINITY_DN50548_c0_g1_i1.p1  ORF type:complete len:1028 (+),score=360.84 TRINITY_DN50548_c0_g1_i1:95-3178(+)